jgi:hypothetical protein
VQNYFDQWLSPAKGFLKGGGFYLQEKEYKLSAFELHLATDRTYNGLKANNLRQVQYMAGHKYVSSTQRYQVSNLDDLKNELWQHHPMK